MQESSIQIGKDENATHAGHQIHHKYHTHTIIPITHAGPEKASQLTARDGVRRLPMPRPGQVLGLVGTNGIGKSTAIKVLAGKLKPNLGRFTVSLGLERVEHVKVVTA